jgi:amino acid transporter
MKNLGLMLLALLLSVFVGLLGAKVVLSVSTLYELSFLADLGFLKIYGLTAILGLILYKDKDSEDNSSEDEKVGKMFGRVITKTLIYLLLWGMAFLMYSILNN